MSTTETIENNNSEQDILTQQLEANCTIEGNFDNIARTFEEMNLNPTVLRGIHAHGFNRPSPIQSRAILPCLQSRDVIAQAQSGTGKTATFVIATLQRITIDPTKHPEPQALVIAPTRELAQQIQEVYQSIGQYCDLKCHALIGGTSVSNDMDVLKKTGAHVIVGTPGRVAHMINIKSLSTSSVKLFILDEADEMLTRGFKEQIYMLFRSVPTQVQVVLLSATISDTVLEVTKSFMINPVHIHVKKEQLTLQGINQYFVVAQDRNNKVDAIIDILGESNLPQLVIFVKSQRDTELMHAALSQNGVAVACIHSGIQQSEREDIMKKFRRSEIKTLISTNLISRGIDVQGVSLVINFDMPRDYETYLHRIGRSGRYGRKGIAINLVLQEELAFIKELETFYSTSIVELPQDIKRLF